MMSDSPAAKLNANAIKQLFRYGMIGVTINLAGYLVYLLITFLGGTPKATMTVLYFAGVVAGFWGNRKLTFKHQGSLFGASARYAVVHGIGYLINLTILILFVDRLGFGHQWVQAVAIFVVASYLFLAFKFFVFANPNRTEADLS